MKHRTIHAVIASAGLVFGPQVIATEAEAEAEPPAPVQLPPGEPDPAGKSLEAEDKTLVTTRKTGLSANAAWLGVATEDVSPVLAAQLGRKTNRGAVVTAVVPDSPAAKAGLKAHDLIVSVEDYELMAPRELTEFMAGKKPGETLSIKILRGGKETTVDATLAPNPYGPTIVAQPPRPPRAPSIFDRRDPLETFRRGGADPFDMLRRMQEDMDQMQEEMRKRFEHSFNFHMGPNSMTQIMRSNGSATLTDNEGTISVEMKEGKKSVKATDPDGKVLFEGPANTDEEVAKMPDAVRERFEKFDSNPFDMGKMGGFDRFDDFEDFFRLEMDPPLNEAPEVQKDFRRVKKPEEEPVKTSQ